MAWIGETELHSGVLGGGVHRRDGIAFWRFGRRRASEKRDFILTFWGVACIGETGFYFDVLRGGMNWRNGILFQRFGGWRGLEKRDFILMFYKAARIGQTVTLSEL